MIGSTHYFPGPFIYSGTVENHLEIKSELLPLIEGKIAEEKDAFFSSPPGNFQTVITSYGFDESKIPELRDHNLLNSVLWSHMDHMFSTNNFLYHPVSREIQGSWFSYYEKGGWHGPHTHPDATFSVIYLLHLEEPSYTTFLNTSTFNPFLFPQTFSVDNFPEGTVFIFPGEIWHFVPPTTAEKRATIIYNVKCEFP